jgi:hypothetical protein
MDGNNRAGKKLFSQKKISPTDLYRPNLFFQGGSAFFNKNLTEASSLVKINAP